ncbi:MAG: site-specific DNA-methyltransferase [Thermoplasmata archaeon]|nr:site-specific DNA-methyltransferase [Thermoplasmata archaeon]
MARRRAVADPVVRPVGRWTDAVIEGDALAVLSSYPSESVHLAVTSPPYNVGISYTGYSDDRRHEEYLSWLGSVWGALHRVLVPGGRFALNVAPTSIKDFRPIHHDLSTDLRARGFIMRTEIIWYKQTMGRRTAWGSWRSPSNPHVVPSWEYVLVFSKGRWKLDGRPEDADITSAEFQQFSDGYWAIPPERRRAGHPAPFPEALIERLVKFYSFREQTVLDMFGGTGTVAAVARRTGRHYVHIDSSSEYCALAVDRIRRASPPSDRPAIPPPELWTY